MSEALIDTFNRKARALADSGIEVVSLGQALPGFLPPAAALSAARKSLESPATHTYAPDAGDPRLQQLIAAWIARHDGVRVDPGTQIIVSAGGNQALMLALQSCCDAGDRVLLPAPYFMNHEMAVRLVDAIPVEVRTDQKHGYVIAARQLFPHPGTSLEPEGSRDRCRAVIITTPNNPTGAIVPGRELDRIARACARRGMFLILDRTYAGFEFGDAGDGGRTDAPRSRPLPNNVVIVGSFSKVFAMTGWRVGYLAASPQVIAQALKAQDTTIICAPTIGQVAVRAALEAGRAVPAPFMRELRRRREYVQKRVQGIRGWSAVPAAGGFFTFVRVEGCVDSIQLAHRLLDLAHVLVMPGRIFGEAGEGHLRISYGVADVPTLASAFDRLQTVT